MEILKLVWKNLWRNKRRTIITIVSVFFAIFFALVMRSLQLGSYDHMFKNIIESYSGYIQVQNKDFWDDKTIDNVFENTKSLNTYVLEDKNVDATIPRLESFALASNGTKSKGVMVMGVDPEKEKYLSNIKDKLIKFRLTDESIKELKKENIPENIINNLDLFNNHSYSSIARLQLDLDIDDDILPQILPFFKKHASYKNGYFQMGKKEVLIGDKLARYLNINVGDTLILIGQGYHGVSAAGKYSVRSIVKIPSPDIDGRIVFLPLDICQDLYGCPNMISSITLHLKNNSDDKIDATIKNLNQNIIDNHSVIGWRTMNKLMIEQMDADEKSGLVMIFILYIVIAFGVFGTVLMMTTERRREFGVLVSIGMQKYKLALIVTIEMLLIGLIGIISGILASFPVILWGHYHPIQFTGEMAKIYEEYGMEPVMVFKLFDTYYFNQAIMVLIIVIIAILYPISKIAKLKEVEALKV